MCDAPAGNSAGKIDNDRKSNEKDGPIFGLQKLIEILEHPGIGLGYLTKKMKPTLVKLTIGLPTEHPVLSPDLLKEGNVTAATPGVSNRLTKPVCASHSVAKAVMAHLDNHGYDGNQQEIIDTLVGNLQRNKTAKNPDEFNGARLIVHGSSKSNTTVEGYVEIEIKVQTQWGKTVDNVNNMCTIPITL